MYFLLCELICLILTLFVCHLDKSIIETQANFNEDLHRHLNEFKIYKWFIILLVIINVILFCLFMIFKANKIYSIAKIIMIIFNEISIFSLIIPALVLLRTSYVNSLICKIINGITFGLSLIMSVAYLVAPFVLIHLNLSNKMQIETMAYISNACCVLFIFEICYLIFVNLEYYELDNKIQAARNYLKNNQDMTKVNKYVRHILIDKKKRKSNDNKWQIPLFFSHKSVKQVIGDNKLYKIVMTRFNSDKN